MNLGKVYTVTPNPTVDKTLRVPELRLGELNRAAIESVEYRGKGITVSLALVQLGIPSYATGWMGSDTYDGYATMLKSFGIEMRFIRVEARTRTNITLIDVRRGVHTKINEPGFPVDPYHIDALLAMADGYGSDDTPKTAIHTLSGSLPPGAPANFYARFIRRAQLVGARCILDASGEALRAGVEAIPFGLKINTEEAGELLGTPPVSDGDHFDAVRDLCGRGIEWVCITRGADGLVLAQRDENMLYLAHSPSVQVESAVAAGDATLAGILQGFQLGHETGEIARRACAFGTATAMMPGSQVGFRSMLDEMIPLTPVTTIPF